MRLKWAKARHDTLDIPDAHIIADLDKEYPKPDPKERAFIMPETSCGEQGYELPEEEEATVIIIEF